MPAETSPTATAQLDALVVRFAQRAPFRHVVIDDFLEPGCAERLLATFPPFDVRRALNEAGDVGRKAVVEEIRGLGPAYAALDDLIRSHEFLALISHITGIPALLYDPHYFGGGTHENRHGQDLDAHVDFNRHPVEGWHRRLNLIVYLNPQWEESWGGCLELHSDPRAADDRVILIVPLFNRCVIFETTEYSWHGFSGIELPPERAHLSRKSVALYFYTRERPASEVADTHSTIYVDRPLPERFRPGRTLDEHDVQELRILLTRRDQHNQRLYRDLTGLQKQLERAQSARIGPLGIMMRMRRKLDARRRG
jgi:hypothetical protein